MEPNGMPALGEYCRLICYVYRLTLGLSCPMVLTHFPMDYQNCFLKISSCKSSLSLQMISLMKHSLFSLLAPSTIRGSWQKLKISMFLMIMILFEFIRISISMWPLYTLMVASTGMLLLSFLFSLYWGLLFSRLTLSLSCPMVLTHFPMDYQRCALKISSCKFRDTFQYTVRCRYNAVNIFQTLTKDTS